MTLHAFAKARDDNDLRREKLASWSSPIRGLSTYCICCIDEAQDLNEPLVNMLMLCLLPNIKNSTMIIVGDFFQCIYKSLYGSSTQYLVRPQEWTQRDFVNCKLSRSFRLTRQMAEFINTHLDPRKMKDHYPKYWSQHGDIITDKWGDGIEGNKEGETVKDIDVDGYNPPVAVIDELLKIICSGKPEDTTLIVSSTDKDKNTPMAKLINRLTDHNWYIQKSGNGERFVEDVHLLKQTKSKACTIWSMKGCETPTALVYGMDKYCERYDDPMSIYNQMYVALTRASRRLIVMGSKRKNGPFFTQRVMKEVTTQKSSPSIRITVTGLLEFVRSEDQITDNVMDTVVVREKAVRPTSNMIRTTVRKLWEEIYTARGVLVEEALAWLLQGNDLEAFPWQARYKLFLEQHPLSIYKAQIGPEDYAWCDVQNTPEASYLPAMVRSADKMLRQALQKLNVKIDKILYHSKVYLDGVSGEVDFIVIAGPQAVIVELKVTRGPHDKSHFHQVMCYGGMVEFDVLTCFVLNPLEGTCIEVKCANGSYREHFRMCRNRKLSKKHVSTASPQVDNRPSKKQCNNKKK